MHLKKLNNPERTTDNRKAYLAILHNDLPSLQEFVVKYGVDAILEQGTALHHAVFNDQAELVQFLLEKKANPNLLYKEQWTPLIAAIDRDQPAIAKLLIEHGADVNQTDGQRNSPLYKALLHFEGDPSLIELLVSKHADPYLDLYNGYTPMKLAVEQGTDQLLLRIMQQYNL